MLERRERFCGLGIPLAQGYQFERLPSVNVSMARFFAEPEHALQMAPSQTCGHTRDVGESGTADSAGGGTDQLVV